VQPASPDEQRDRTMTLEAFADTIVPGEKRSPDDVAIAGAAPGPGAVVCGALEVLSHPATGIAESLGYLAGALNAHAAAYTAELGITVDGDVPTFVGMSYEQRAGLVQKLTTPGHPEKDGWVLLALFSNMAFDSAPHRHTAEALADGHPGLLAMGITPPDADGYWRFPHYSYGRQLASPHPDTDASGSLS
jgi:enediyne biosynthesis protein E8